ncbi:hypothetical protein VTK56DRAFT_9669 [Thermocarpiscus australiensis]
MPGRKRKSAAVAEEKDTVTPSGSASRRRSQRISSSAQKSKYFEADTTPDTSENEIATNTPRGRGRPPKKAKVKEPDSGSEAEAPVAEQNAADSDEEFDEDAPPKVTYVPLPKLRDTGGVEYADDRLHKNTLAFLKDLKANNKRSWLKAHDQEYRRALKDWESYVTTLTEKIIDADPTIPELPFKDVNFRIYRDIRFSKDPTPYKPHFSAAFSRTGRKGPYACYYVHVEPGSCFVGGGLWHPDAGALHRLRASVDERPRRWRRVLSAPAFRETFLGLSPSSSSSTSASTSAAAAAAGKRKRRSKEGGGGRGEKEDETEVAVEEAAIEAFAAANQEGALKTRPKGFIPDHRDMQLLKLRNFTVGKRVPDDVFTSLEGGQAKVAGIVRDMVGFVTHLNRIVMPDPEDDDDESDDE